jgi:Na+-driven multidrug efflux pump
MFTNWFNYELYGIALAQNITDFCTLGLLMVYMQIKKQKCQVLKDSWIAITRTSLNKFCEYTKIAFDSFLLFGLHNFSYFIIASFAGWLGVNEYAAITFLNIFSIQIAFFHMSFSYALSALIGQYLGSN